MDINVVQIDVELVGNRDLQTCRPTKLVSPESHLYNVRASRGMPIVGVRVRFHIIRNARIENVGKSQSCMVSKLPIIWKQTVLQAAASDLALGGQALPHLLPRVEHLDRAVGRVDVDRAVRTRHVPVTQTIAHW